MQHASQPTIIVSLPGAPDCDNAAKAATDAGALVFRQGSTRSTPSKPADTNSGDPILVGAQWWLTAGADDHIKGLGANAYVEVTSVEQATAALQAGARQLVACGAEGAGLVGHESTLVLVRRVLELATAAQANVWARGGIGPDSAAACIAAGATGVVLDSQLLAADDVPLSDAMAKRVSRFNPADTQALGGQFGLRYRVFAQLATKPVRELAAKAATAGMQRGDWLQAVSEVLADQAHHANPKTDVVELGQDLALGQSFVERCGWRTVGAIVTGLGQKLAADAETMIWPWGEGGGVASVNGTRFPLHQGPMAQVADVAGFAEAVFNAGAMPWLALANMPASIAEDTVKATFERMGDRPFGAGIIGLDANRYRDQHIEMLKRLRPAAVMVAAGTAEQAHDFQNAGLTTWLHTPTPGLLRAALEAGLRRFIVEGSEAGGHVGQLGSLVLWQMAVDEVLRSVASGVPAGDISLVLAGGLGDSAASHAAAALVQPLVKAGVRCGQQCGTAYLMTSEAVASGAIRPAYQMEIARAKQTVLMGETVRTPTRVLPTTAADRIFASELERERSDTKLHDKKSAYEHDNLGGLRAAAKAQKIVAVDKVKGATFADLDDAEQSELGLYHAGEIAALLSETTTMAALHETLTVPTRPTTRPAQAGASASAPSPPTASRQTTTESPSGAIGKREAIAIVGVGAVLPDAPNVEAFWNNLRTGHSSVAEVPKDRWNSDLLWDADKSTEDKTYSKIGAFVKNFEFNRKAFRVPPKVVQSLDFAQKMALEAGRQALADANDGRDDFPSENCAVIVGNSQGGELRLETAFRTEIPGLRKNVETALAGVPLSAAERDAVVERFVAEALSGRTPITEDTMAGELPNCIAGRMAGTFDLGGPNFIADAACASSLAAIHVAIRGLREHEYDAALVGGVDNMMGTEPYVKFCKIGALSPDGSKPFDTDANGFVMGEGAAMFVLMRESDARASGRRIYARILGSGASSDGRGKGITAPNPRGQTRALSRAYRDAGIDPKQVTMFEAHGTGTAVGDPVEVSSLVETVGATAHGASLGSVKSNIGHLKAGAGAAAILKTTLALAHRTLVPTLNVKTPNPKLPLAAGNLRLQRETQPWNVPAGVARVAGVSAFGFGGTNVHVVLAEADGAAVVTHSAGSSSTSTPDSNVLNAPANATSAAKSVGSSPSTAGASVDGDAVYGRLVALVCERTGYDADELEPDFELEADLGIDTVKQAEIMAAVRETYGMEADADFRLADYPTLAGLARYVVERVGISGGAVTSASTSAANGNNGPSPEQIYSTLVDLVCERTGYDADELEPDFELEADLGIDTVKQAEIMAAVRESYGLEADADFRLADYPTLAGLARYVVERLGAGAGTGSAVSPTAGAAAATAGPNQEAIYGRLVELVCDRTGYDADELEPEFELEADLGIDTVKQAEIMAAVREVYGLETDADFRLADYPTLAGLARYVVEQLGGSASSSVATSNGGGPATAVGTSAGNGRNNSSNNTLAGLMVVGADDTSGLASAIETLSADLRSTGLGVLNNIDRPAAAARPVRLAVAFEPSEGAEALAGLLDKAVAAAKKGKGAKLLANKGVYFGEGKHEGKVAFLFPGQGSQYLGMLADMASDFPQVQATFDEADGVMASILDRPLSTYIHPQGLTDDASKMKAFMALTQTEITQPAMLTADIALLRVLSHLGFEPDVVAGHSLGEYAACVAAGVMDFQTALTTVAARGTAMANVEPMDGDCGKMAAVAGPVEVVEAALAEVDGYVVCANKNCPSQTVIGGSSAAVEAAGKVLADKGLDVMFLPVSHAFHTRVVAAATTPLRAHLDAMSISAPTRAILSNVTADYYPTDTTAIAELLSQQVAAPVEYIREIERMYADGVTTFVEVGPKRAQAGFVSATLGVNDRPHRAIFTNHPKLGGRVSLRRAVAQMVAAGLTAPPNSAPHATPPSTTPSGFDAAPTLSNGAATGAATAAGDTAWAVSMPVVCTGTALGVPGTERLFDALDEAQLGDALFLSDRTLIGHLDDAIVEGIIGQRITRLEKGADGTANFVPIERREQAVKLAGRIGAFDLVEDFGVDERVAKALDEASQLAVAAGLEALRHAGLPLIPKYRVTRSGKQIANGWSLPKEIADSTGVLFASGFTGLDAAFEAAQLAATNPDYTFDPRLLLRIMGMGHSRFAEVVGARGPNASVDLACASTTGAVAMAEDWIKAGRCERVIVIGGDNVTSDTMMPWVGSGFLASGAASDADDPTKAALPFDVRRNGTILGAGAVALVVESAASAAKRGVTPLADLVATYIANSAFHQTRLDVNHVAECFEKFVSLAEKRLQLNRHEIAQRAVFVSHETFTPARGGSAAAEVESLRGAFQGDADNIWISNVKGYTGHPMGAGLEDSVALLMLQRQQVLGIPHLEQPDPTLGNLRYARNEKAELDYALRFAAGFGSQMALTMWRRRATTTNRVNVAQHQAWLESVAPELGAEPLLEVERRVLRAKSSGKPARAKKPAAVAKAATAKAIRPTAAKAEKAPAETDDTPAAPRCEARQVCYDEQPHGPAQRAAITAAFTGKNVRIIGGSQALTESFERGVVALGGTVATEADSASTKPLDGVIDLSAWDADTTESATLAVISNAQSIQAPSGFFLLVTPGDGRCGGDASHPIGAAARGVAKSLGREWPDTRVVAVDVPQDLLDDALATRVLAEAAGPNRDREVGVTASGRTRVSLAPAERSTTAPKGSDAWTWLVSGGARGITATIVEDLATRKLGGRFVLLGRTPLDGEIESLAALDPKAERARIKEELKAAGGRVTPAAVNKEIAPLLKRQEIAATVLKLRATGATVTYEVCDIGAVADVKRVVKAVTKGGKIHGCIHGAGAEDSQLLADKSAASVAKCFGAKVDGISHLVAALPKSCRTLIGFGSISGHFGNAGQVDYAAANEAMAKTISAWGAAAPKGVRRQSLTVHWSAWAEVGMATRGSVGAVLQSLGIELILPNLASPIVGDLVCSGISGEVVAAGALGALDSAQGAGTMLDAQAQPRDLQPATDAALNDHRIDGVAVLPGVLGMELFAQNASAAGMSVGGFEDVKFERPVKYHRDKTVPLEVARNDDGTSTLWATRSLAGGRTAKDAHFVGRPVSLLSAPLDAVPGLGDRRLREGPDADGIYEVFFHTGVFRVLENVPWIDEASIVALGRAPAADLAPSVSPATLLTDPLTREMGFQAAGLCAMAAFERRYLPAGVDTVELVASATPGEQVIVRAIDITEDDTADARRFDVDLVTVGGQVLQRLRGLTMVAAGPLPDGIRVQTRDSSFPITEQMNVTGAASLLERLLADSPTGALTDIFHASGVTAYERYRSPLRRAEWVAGRLAIKQLAQRWLLGVHGTYRSLPELSVIADENRAPHLRIGDAPTGLRAAISISHACGEAIVVLDPRPGARVGVDLEIVQTREAGFQNIFTASEMALSKSAPVDGPGDRFLTQLWCVKEAVSKVLGLGFALAFEEILVVALDQTSAEVALAGKASVCAEALGLTIERITLTGDDSSVVAVATATAVAPTAVAADHDTLAVPPESTSQDVTHWGQA